MKPVLFVDRDGVIIEEPPEDLQVDTLEQLKFKPGVICALSRIMRECDYLLVMVSNQDGLGSEAYPQESFDLVQRKMVEVLSGEGIVFDAIHIDSSWPWESAPTRKPGTAMLDAYLHGGYDLDRSIVIGDRLTDIELALNIGCRAVWYADPASRKVLDDQASFAEFHRSAPERAGTTAATDAMRERLAGCCVLVSSDWEEISSLITGNPQRLPKRTAAVHRRTAETEITAELSLDGTGIGRISTGIRFFDHMLEQLARHSLCDISLTCSGDLDVDEHHTIEDTALVLGQAFSQALGDKLGISRYGFSLPMDEASAEALIDFSGRPWLVWDASFTRDKVGDMPTEMIFHFFKSFSDAARCNLHLKAAGENAHHTAEALFKAFARAVRGAVKRDLLHMALPSTKGTL